MALVKYTFTKATVSPDGLAQEIALSSIQTALSHIETVGVTLYIYFRADLSPADEITLDALVDAHDGTFHPMETPTDPEGAPIIRTKAAAPGWSLQLHGVEFTTSKIGGIYNGTVDPLTGAESDLGFATVKLYDAKGNEITTEAGESNCVQTRIDWRTTHDFEIRGAALAQGSKPESVCRLWAIAAPGLANKFFSQGGINLQNFDPGQFVTAEGVASKFMSATKPIAGANRMRIILKHAAGLQHTAQLLFYLYVP